MDVENLNCIGCEICQPACHQNAIEMKFEHGMFTPERDTEACIDCTHCIQICPSRMSKIQRTLLANPSIESYTACAEDNVTRFKGASGGVISAMITELIQNCGYNCTFVLKDSIYGEPTRLEAVMKMEDIEKSVGSKYVPASAFNVIKALQTYAKADFTLKCIVVGTPCVLRGIRNYMRLHDIPEDNILFFGLFCDGTMHYNFLRYIADRYGKFEKLNFRSKVPNGWPGDMLLELNGGQAQAIPRTERMKLKPIFMLPACLSCNDKLNPYADIAFGDCYIPLKADKKGKSFVIVRTEKGEEAWNLCSGVIEAEIESLEAIKKAQGIGVKKPDSWFYRWLIRRGMRYNYYEVRVAVFAYGIVTKIQQGLKIAKIGIQVMIE